MNFSRLLNPIKRQIYLIIGRAIMTYVNNSETTQKVQLNLLADEVASDVERFQEYGFETYPHTQSEALAAFINGNRAHGIVICVHDRRYRPSYLSEGEVVIYTSEDQSSPNHRIHFKQNNEIELKCDLLDQDIDSDNTIDIGGDKTETISGNKVNTISGNKQNSITGNKTESAAVSTETITGTKQITSATALIIAANIALNGTTVIGGGIGAGKSIATEDIISIFNNHTHDENGDGGGTTDPPNQQLSSSQMTTNSKAV